MWMSFTLTSRRHPSHKRLAQGPQELKPVLSWPITRASISWNPHSGGTSLALQLLQWILTSQSDCRDVSWMDMGGNDPKMGHWMPLPSLTLLLPFSCQNQWLRGPGGSAGRAGPPQDGEGEAAALLWAVMGDRATRLPPSKCNPYTSMHKHTGCAKSSPSHLKCTHISTNPLESAHKNPKKPMKRMSKK